MRGARQGRGMGSASHATRSKSERARTGLTSQPSKPLSAICPNARRSNGENSTRLRRTAASRAACASRLVASGPSAQSTMTTSGLCEAFNASRPESKPWARSTSTPASIRRASIAGASNGELAMMRARVPPGTRRIVSEAANGSTEAHFGNWTAKAKIDPPPGLSESVSSPPMRRTSSREMASPNPAPSKRRACEVSPCSKLSKTAFRRSAGTPGPVSITEKRAAPISPPLDRHADAASIGKFDRVAGEVHEDLAQARSVRADEARRAGAERSRDLNSFALGARREQFNYPLGKSTKIDPPDDELKTACLYLGQIENFVDQCDQRAPGTADRFNIACVFGVEGSLPQQIGHAENAADRSADLVAHRRQKARFGLARRLCSVARARCFLETPKFIAQPVVLGGDPRSARFRLTSGAGDGAGERSRQSNCPASLKSQRMKREIRQAGAQIHSQSRLSSASRRSARRSMVSGSSCEPLEEFGRIVRFAPILCRRDRAVWCAAVGERFGEMHATGWATSVQVGKRASKLKHAVIAARRQAEPFGCVTQQRQT